MLSRIAFPAAEATFGARWAARAGPVRGPPAATKFEDYTVLQIVVSSGACTRGATKSVYSCLVLAIIVREIIRAMHQEQPVDDWEAQRDA